MVRHKVRVENRVADALSQCVMMLSTMRVEVVGLERLKEAYADCLDFGLIYTALQAGPSRDYHDYVL